MNGIGVRSLDLGPNGQFETLAGTNNAGTVAARFVVVDALDEAARRFYEHHGFG